MNSMALPFASMDGSAWTRVFASLGAWWRSSLAPETPTRIAKRPNKVARDTGAAPTPGAPPSIGLRQVAAHAAATSQPSQAPVPDRARKRWRAAAIRCAVAWDAAAMTVAALDMREANEYATRLGRRLGALHGDRFALAIEQTGAGQVKGLAVCARPGDRRLDDALTLVIECFSTESACAPVDGLLMRSIAVEASRRGYRRLLVRGGPHGPGPQLGAAGWAKVHGGQRNPTSRDVWWAQVIRAEVHLG